MTKLIRSSDQVCVVEHLKFADSYLSRLWWDDRSQIISKG